MSKQVLNTELSTLLQLSKQKISSEAFETILKSINPSFNWTYFLERAIATNLAGYLLPYPELAQIYYPPFVLTKIKNYQQRIQLHSSFLREAILVFTPQLNQAKIPYALLKGWDLHFRFGISLKERQISDIDLLINLKDLDHIKALFEKLGYSTRNYIYKSKWHEQYLKKHSPLHFYKEGITIDIHTHAFSQENEIHLELDLSQREIILVDHTPIALLTKEEAALFGLLHFAKHFESGKTLKVAMIQDLDLYSQLLDLQNLEVQKHQSLITQIHQFLEATQQNNLSINTRFNEVFLRHLEGRNPSFKGYLIDIINRLRPKTSFIHSLLLIYFDLMPNKKYLEANFGKGSYFKLWSQRLKKRLAFCKGYDKT